MVVKNEENCSLGARNKLECLSLSDHYSFLTYVDKAWSEALHHKLLHLEKTALPVNVKLAHNCLTVPNALAYCNIV
jgi:hypothetical protein